MRWTAPGLGAALVATLAMLGPVSTPVAAQVSEALDATEEGTVRFTYAVREGVRICADGFRMSRGHDDAWVIRGRSQDQGECRDGTAEVELSVRQGRVVEIDLLAPGEPRAREARDLGRVNAPVAARALLDVAGRAGARPWEDAVFAAVVADSIEVWPDLLALARDEERPERVRKSALFWLGQEAAAAVTAGLADTARNPSEDPDIREAAVFALAQRPEEESLPALMELARGAPDADTRESALFWLAQSEDPRIPGFFEALILDPGPR